MTPQAQSYALRFEIPSGPVDVRVVADHLPDARAKGEAIIRGQNPSLGPIPDWRGHICFMGTQPVEERGFKRVTRPGGRWEWVRE